MERLFCFFTVYLTGGTSLSFDVLIVAQVTPSVKQEISCPVTKEILWKLLFFPEKYAILNLNTV
ncbi:MAG: hypothetical protein LUD79_04495, partial [Oscillospiraceae bacterium]|nr:hypothetical protein [Oscillospiraceae bacterium]